MAKKRRYINGDIWQHRSFRRLGMVAQQLLFYLGIAEADEYGKFEWDPEMVLDIAWGRRSPVSIEYLEAALVELIEANLVETYDASTQIGVLQRGWFKGERREPKGWKITRDSILDRDSACCQWCGDTGSGAALAVHHILPRRHGGRENPDNLIVMCGKCHRKAHGKRSEIGLALQQGIRMQHGG